MAEPDRSDRDDYGRTAGDHGGGPLIVRSTPVPDPLDLLRELPVPAALAWVRHGAGLVGWGEALRLTLPAGDDRFTAARKWLRDAFDGADVQDEVRRRGSGPVAFGAFTFDDHSAGSVLIVPRVVLGRDGTGAAWRTTISRRGEAADPGGDDGAADPVPPRPPAGITWRDGALPPAQWEQAVAAAVRRITRGDLRKVVLARDIYATADQPVDQRVLLRRLAARYPDCYTFACDGLLGATPELLISRDGREVTALVLAGTAPRGATGAADERNAAALLASAKDNEEHLYAVASMRESLAPLCERLDTAPRPELVRLPNLLHLGTPVRGTLSGDPSALELAAAVHPTAAVGGTPTVAAVELIRELEHMDRARYAGPVGWMNAAGDGEWCIALRCAQVDGNTARLFAGGGIVAGSVPATELAETNVKFRPVRAALEETGLSTPPATTGRSTGRTGTSGCPRTSPAQLHPAGGQRPVASGQVRRSMPPTGSARHARHTRRTASMAAAIVSSSTRSAMSAASGLCARIRSRTASGVSGPSPQRFTTASTAPFATTCPGQSGAPHTPSSARVPHKPSSRPNADSITRCGR
jgi:menaquinone-specific isochorismate synthase